MSALLPKPHPSEPTHAEVRPRQQMAADPGLDAESAISTGAAVLPMAAV